MTGKILFLCDRNAVRSPMAASMLPGSTSAGLDADDAVNPFVASMLPELVNHEPRTVTPDDLAGAEIVIALSPTAFEAARDWKSAHDFDLEYWQLPEIPSHEAPREVILDGYRAIHRALAEHLKNRGL